MKLNDPINAEMVKNLLPSFASLQEFTIEDDPEWAESVEAKATVRVTHNKTGLDLFLITREETVNVCGTHRTLNVFYYDLAVVEDDNEVQTRSLYSNLWAIQEGVVAMVEAILAYKIESYPVEGD